MKKLPFTFLVLLLATGCATAQTNYTINIDVPEKEIMRGHLNLGGTNPSGDSISVNSYFMEKNGEPFFPIKGEFHFSRYPAEYWEESLKKMKAGGINTIATYVFWNIHEREEGVFDWNGNLNLRRFLELIEKHDMYAIVRLGPFCHGEMRNGGIPDWMYGRTFEVRSNHPDYLAYVDRLYGEIASQMKGYYFKDGGPIIGVQLENEYQHSAAPWEITYPGSRMEFTVPEEMSDITHVQITITDGVNPWYDYGHMHMQNLKRIALEKGIDVPIYTATGWGNATIIEKASLPVTAAYPYPFWADPAPSPFYMFKDIHADPDYSPVSYDPELYPSMPAEVGPGKQVIWSRRPVVDPKSVAPMIVRILGSGANGIGYYMYHGGSTPTFDGKFYNEQQNGIPKINYDFQAPIGQYGQVRYHHKSLKLLHMFLESYGQELALMKTVLPETNADITPENTETLRYALRSYGDSGFLFVINFQDHMDFQDINEVSVDIQTSSGVVSFPNQGTMDILRNTSAILPFNLALDAVHILSATVQPLTILETEHKTTYVFYSHEGITPEIVFDRPAEVRSLNHASVENREGGVVVTGNSRELFSFTTNGMEFLILPRKIALDAYKIGEKLILSDALVLEKENNLHLLSRKPIQHVHMYPGTTELPLLTNAGLEAISPLLAGMTSYRLIHDEYLPQFEITEASERKFSFRLKEGLSTLNDVFLEVDYTGDRGMAFIDGLMVTDHFYHDSPWEIGLKSFLPELYEKEMVLIFHPAYPDYGYLQDLRTLPDSFQRHLEVRGFLLIPEYKSILHIR